MTSSKTSHVKGTPPAGPHCAKLNALVTSAHLVAERSPESSELEFGLIMAANAFNRWVVRCMAAAGLPDLTTLDVLVLHHVHHRDRPKKTADICFTLHVEDTHTVTYALKKLVGLGVVAGENVGKEVFYATTARGRDYMARYREIRDTCFVESLADGGPAKEELRRAAQVIRMLSGSYDQAARAASAL
jgi:predicted MarR family transcription regulator